MFFRIFLIITLLYSLPKSTFGQIRIEVLKHPPFSLSDSSLYLSGTFNGWSPGHENFKLQRDDQGIYFINLPDSLNYFEYKFTQGSWALVEGSNDGKVRPNRIYNRGFEKNPKLIQVEIEGWEQQPAYVIIVKRIPKNTPHDASLYIMGNFNNWNPADKPYRLFKQVDGTYRVLIYSPYEEVQFKFTRGTVSSVESRPGGRLMSNRIVPRSHIKINSDVEVEINAWSDLQDRTQLYSIYDLLLLFSFFQGILLIITIPSIQGYNHTANRWLLFLIGFSSLMMLVKVISNYQMVLQDYPKLQLIPDFIFFIYSPLFFFYIQRLLFQSHYAKGIRLQMHFVPALIQFFVYMAYFLMNDSEFESKLYYPFSDLYIIRFSMACAALFINFYYWISFLRTLKVYKENYKNSNSYEQNLQYLNTVLFMQAICIFAWLGVSVVALAGKLLGWDVFSVVEFGIETIWIVFSMITFFLGYFAIHEPEIFRVPEEEGFAPSIRGLRLSDLQLALPIPFEEVKEAEISANDEEHETIENLEAEVEKISKYMDQFKPYTNSKLTLVELSGRLNLPPYLLSKIINNGFGKNFFDFVNGYRIEEFKRRVEDPQYKNYTLLSIAFDVGFNSKTAFNRSFKKITNQTPSSYFQNKREF